MTEPRKQLNVRLPESVIERVRRVKDRHPLRPSWDHLIEALVTGEEKLVDLEKKEKKTK